MSLPTDLPGCGAPATTVFEIFTRAGGEYSLDGRLNVCAEHAAAAVQILRDAGFEPYRAHQPATRCGEGFDYQTWEPLQAPVVAPTPTVQDARREALERNLAIAEASGYTYIVDNNRRLLAALDAREPVTSATAVTPGGAPTTAERARALRLLVWSWLPEEPDHGVGSADTIEPTADEQRATALALLEQVRDAQQFLASWTDRLIRIASDNDATNPQIGAALGVGKERIRRRLLKEPA